MGKRYLLMDRDPLYTTAFRELLRSAGVENHLRTAVREYVTHYHTERNHQGLEGRLIEPPANAAGAGPIMCRERIGGLLRFYHWQAA